MSEKYMKDMLYEETIDSKTVFTGKIIKIETDTIRLADGSKSYREVLRKKGGVCVVPITPDGDIIFVNQFRYPYGEVIIELPAGKIEKDEDPKICGIREMFEETGCTSDNIIYLGKLYPSPGIMDEIVYMYIAFDVKEGKSHLDKGEFLTTEMHSLEEAVQMVLDNKIPDAKTQIAILKTLTMKQKWLI